MHLQNDIFQGIIGADLPNDFNISGVAFDASLSAYRVFGCEGSATDDGVSFPYLSQLMISFPEQIFTVIVDALLRGAKDGQHILTLSLGGADGWTESSSSVVASRLADSGIIVTIAAGNDVKAICFIS